MQSCYRDGNVLKLNKRLKTVALLLRQVKHSPLSRLKLETSAKRRREINMNHESIEILYFCDKVFNISCK